MSLTIAGSDSGGGAGIQADTKTFTRFGVFGTSVITAITAQNTEGVSLWEPVSTPLIRAQMDAVLKDLEPESIKTGMLGNAEVVRTIVERLIPYDCRRLVVDPVMVATSGDILLEQDAVAVICDTLIPLARVVTPNLDEVRILLGSEVTNVDDMHDAAKTIVTKFGAKAALVKGGHLKGHIVTDVLYDGDFCVFENRRIETTSTHGTGCTLSAAIASKLALGISLRDSVREAISYVHNAIATAPTLGHGHGPLNHWA